MTERVAADGFDGFRDGHIRQASTVVERPLVDRGDRVGDYSALATSYQGIACRLDDSIAIISGIILWVATFNDYARQRSAFSERIISNKGNRARNGQAC